MFWLCLQENPAVILGDLRAIKAKHLKLLLEMEEITAAQKQSMNSVRTSMNAIRELTQHLQRIRDLEVPSPTRYTLFNLMLYWCSGGGLLVQVFILTQIVKSELKKIAALMKINNIIHILLFWKAFFFLNSAYDCNWFI